VQTYTTGLCHYSTVSINNNNIHTINIMPTLLRNLEGGGRNNQGGGPRCAAWRGVNFRKKIAELDKFHGTVQLIEQGNTDTINVNMVKLGMTRLAG